MRVALRGRRLAGRRSRSSERRRGSRERFAAVGAGLSGLPAVESAAPCAEAVVVAAAEPGFVGLVIVERVTFGPQVGRSRKAHCDFPT
jgi:hypothetical protein